MLKIRNNELSKKILIVGWPTGNIDSEHLISLSSQLVPDQKTVVLTIVVYFSYHGGKK